MKMGNFIVFEGIDGCGSTSHAALTVKWLNQIGYEAILTKEPTDSKIGSLIRSYLKDSLILPETDALLFAADRNEHSKWIERQITLGKIVICDRYLESSIAYQSSQRLSTDWILTLNKYSIKPDLNILLLLKPEIAITRKSFTEKFEKLDFLKQVQDVYLQRAKQAPNEWMIINSEPPIDQVQQEIEESINEFLMKFKPKKNEKL